MSWGNGTPGATEAMRDAPSRVTPEVSGFEILERLGRGGMGEVYLARQLTLGRLVAIKFLMPEGDSDPARDLARFRREAELMARVSHPNVLAIHDFGEADGRPYLVMEYVEAGDLRRVMVAEQPMSPAQVRSIVLPVGEALAYLHRQGIIHRDLKPENILLHNGEDPRVADFGIAVLRAGAGALTQTGGGLGTLGYVAPEQQYRLKVDERADQYSLAALAYEMLTGQLPLGIFKPPSARNPRLGPELDAVIVRALQEDPNDRFATIRDFTAALDRALAAAPTRPWHPAGRRLAWAGLGLLVISGTIGAYQTRTTPPDPILPRGPRTLASPADPATTHPAADPAPAARPAPPSLIEELKRLRARQIWEARGRPTGPAGEAVKDEIWAEAEQDVEKRLQGLAYAIWEAHGRPTGPAGEAVKDRNWAEAQRRLYKMLRGTDPPNPGAR